jgi:hypothetical protein
LPILIISDKNKYKDIKLDNIIKNKKICCAKEAKNGLQKLLKIGKYEA